MKIIQIFNRYCDVGGEEKSAQRIYEHLSGEHEVRKLWVESQDWVGKGWGENLLNLAKMFHNWEFRLRMKEMVDIERPDFFLCHNIYPVASPAVYVEALKLGIPVVQYVHNFRPFSVGGSLWTGTAVAPEGLNGRHGREVLAGSWQNSVPRSFLFSCVLKTVQYSGSLNAVSCWIAISEFMREKFIAAGIPPEKIATLRHSWDCLDPMPSISDKGYYLCLARIVPEKGVCSLLEAWSLLYKLKGDSCPNLIIGGTGADSDCVEEAVRENPKVSFVGFVSGVEKSKLISQCRAMLAPSIWWEPLGLVAYEAYDYNKLILGSRTGGLSEIIQDGVTGFTHEPGNAEDISEKVLAIENLNEDERLGMGSRGREWLLSEALPERWMKSFNEIVSKRLDKEYEN